MRNRALATVVAALLSTVVLQASATIQSQSAAYARTETVVHIDVVARDRYVDQLRDGNFQFSVSNKALNSRFLGFDVPCSIIVLLDTSRSMSRPDMGETLEAISTGLVDTASIHSGTSEYALAAMSDDFRVVSGFDGEPRRLTALPSQLPEQHRSLVYDACGKAVALLRDRPMAKRSLILISDGEDNQSHMSLPQLRRLLIESGVLFYGIYYTRQSPPGDVKSPFGPDILQDLAEASGGLALTANKPADVRSGLRAIAVDLRNQYSFAVQLGEQVPGRQIKIDVKLKVPDDARDRLNGRLRYRNRAYVLAGTAGK